MANPTVKGTIPQAASLTGALYVADDVDNAGSPVKGAWDAKNSVLYSAFGAANLTGVALTSGRRGLLSSAAVCGVDIGGADGHTTKPWDINRSANNPFTIMLLIRPQSTGSMFPYENQESFSPNKGMSLNPSGGFVQFTATELPTNISGPSSGGGQYAVGDILTLALTSDGTTERLYKNGTQIATANITGTTSFDYGSTQRRATLFNYPQSKGSNAVACEIYGMLVWSAELSAAELQSFGSNATQLENGQFHSTAFDFGDSLTLTGSNTTYANLSGTGEISLGPVPLVLTGSNTVMGNLSGTGALTFAAGTFTSDPLYKNNGTLQANVTLDYVAIYDDLTHELVATRTNITTNGSGVFSVNDSAIFPGVNYRVDWKVSTGERRMPVKAAV